MLQPVIRGRETRVFGEEKRKNGRQQIGLGKESQWIRDALEGSCG